MLLKILPLVRWTVTNIERLTADQKTLDVEASSSLERQARTNVHP